MAEFNLIMSAIFFKFNPYAAELPQAIFHSFEAGIANAISSSKWRNK